VLAGGSRRLRLLRAERRTGALLLGRDSARRQQAREGYNDESVFQGKSSFVMMSDSTLMAKRACAAATAIYIVYIRFSCLSFPK
jgi:hypothetical protein